MTYDGLLFDKDGTLLDCSASYAPATLSLVDELAQNSTNRRLLLEAVGLETEPLSFLPHSVVIAGTADDIANALSPHVSPALRRTLPDLIGDHYARHTNDNVRMLPEVSCTLEKLHQQGLSLGVATNDHESLAHKHLKTLGLLQYMSFVTGYDSGYGAKPGSGMIKAFCANFDFSPKRVAMIGDSLTDMRAARAAGVTAVAVCTGPYAEDVFKDTADIVINSMAELPKALGLDREKDTFIG